MKIFVLYLSMLAIPVAAVSLVLAGHVSMVIPYEKAMGHYEKMPFPESGDVRHYITSHTPYRKAFTLWPGKGELYTGQDPHGALLTTYVNDVTLESLKIMKGMQNNSLIVTENYNPDRNLTSVTVMYKVKGYNPDGDDWFWAKYDPSFKILSEGKVKECMDCHGKVRDNDSIYAADVRK